MPYPTSPQSFRSLFCIFYQIIRVYSNLWKSCVPIPDNILKDKIQACLLFASWGKTSNEVAIDLIFGSIQEGGVSVKTNHEDK